MADRIVGIKIENDKTEEVIRALNEKLPIALKAIGQEVETYAKKDCPVDTGRLRNSIAFATSKESDGNADSRPKATPENNYVYIGTNVSYAEKQEYGDFHHKVGKKHYLRDAAANHADHYKNILKAALES